MLEQTGEVTVTEEQYKMFKRTCLEYQEKLQLNEWKIYFSLEPLGGAFGRIYKNIEGSICTIKMNTKWDTTGLVVYLDEELIRNSPVEIGQTLKKQALRALNTAVEESIVETAQHEMLHLLVGRLAGLAMCRFVTEDEVVAVEEALVRKLSNYIKI